MTKAIHRFVFALVCVGIAIMAISARAADSTPFGVPARTIWDPRVMPASATDESPAVDLYATAQPASPQALPPASGGSLSSVYPKPLTQPAPQTNAATTISPSPSQPSTSTYSRPAAAANSLAVRTAPPPARVRQAAAVGQPSTETQSVTAPQTMPAQPTPPGQVMPSQVTSEQPGVPTQAGEPPLGTLDFDWGLHKPSDSCPDGSCEGDSHPWYRSVSWFAGGDYLLVNAHLANPVAFREQSAVTSPTLSTDISTGVKYNFDNISDFHVFAGFNTSCGDAYRFGYWHIEDANTQVGTASGNFAMGVGTGTEFTGPGISVATAGDTLTATSHILLNMIDGEHLQRIEVPGCDPCNCPTTNVEWMYGFRIAQFHRAIDAFAPAENGAPADSIQSASGDTQFYGAGPRVGFEASHALCHTAFSAYITANASLLFGDFRERTSTTVPGIFQTAVSETEDNALRIIPNFEMTAGLRWQPTCRTTFEAGYLFELFGNMASTNSTSCTNCSGMTASGVGSDVSFDGLTVRMEHCF